MSYSLNSHLKAALVFVASICSFTANSFELGPVQIHGFLSQGYIYSSGNEYLQGSDSGGTFDFSEAAINFLYRPTDRIFLSSQLISRNFGDAYSNEKDIDIDYMFLSANLHASSTNEFNINLGRLKTSYGIFNNSRNIPFTHVGIISDQTLYNEYDRHLTLYGDGISLDFKHRADFGDLRLVYQNAVLTDDKKDAFATAPEVADMISDFDDVKGQVLYLSYSLPNKGLDFSFSHSLIEADKIVIPNLYHPALTFFNRYWRQKAKNNILSARYRSQNYTLTAEYINRSIHHTYDNQIISNGVIVSEESIQKTDSVYLQGAYRFRYDIEGFISYHRAVEKTNGETDYNTPFNKFRKQWVVGSNWDIFEDTLLKAEMHFIDGNFDMIKEPGINQDGIDRKWNMFVMQISYKF